MLHTLTGGRGAVPVHTASVRYAVQHFLSVRQPEAGVARVQRMRAGSILDNAHHRVVADIGGVALNLCADTRQKNIFRSTYNSKQQCLFNSFA